VARPPRAQGDSLDLSLIIEPLSLLYGDPLQQDARDDPGPDRVVESVPVRVGGAVRYRHVALGAYVRGSQLLLCRPDACQPDDAVRVRLGNAAAAVAFWLGEGEFVAAVGPSFAYADTTQEDVNRRAKGLGGGISELVKTLVERVKAAVEELKNRLLGGEKPTPAPELPVHGPSEEVVERQPRASVRPVDESFDLLLEDFQEAPLHGLSS
jgi:hypothetical protein